MALTREQNDRLTLTDAGTPMGDVLRRYWIPAVLSSEIPEPDCPPVKVMLLGEKLIAFRDTNGRVGILQEQCPHRTASLWLGRNEECGIRCVYHGWKFDVDGKCVDQPNEPPQFQFKEQVKITAYPTVEVGDIIWAYMGPRDKMPAPPHFEMTQVPPAYRNVSKTLEECNWLQALEGGVDTSHLGFLHHGLARRAFGKLKDDDATNLRLRSPQPLIELDTTEYGYRYAGIRPLGDEGNYVRGYHFVMPWTQIRPTQAKTRTSPTGERVTKWRSTIGGHFWVPRDNHTCMVWNWDYSFGDDPLDAEERNDNSAGHAHVLFEEEFRKRRNIDNNWMIDREAQRHKSYSGIQGVNTQDHAVQESMGPIADRTKENLGQTDLAIVTLRRLLFAAADAVAAGKDPVGTTEAYYPLRGMEKIVPPGRTWRDELLPLMARPAEAAE